MIETWGPSTQFSGTVGRVPVPLSSQPLPDGGVRLLLEKPDDVEIVVRARWLRDGREAFRGSTQTVPKTDVVAAYNAVLVSVSTNAPDELQAQRLIKLLAEALRGSFGNSRIHYPR
jgi:hypothetical protein